MSGNNPYFENIRYLISCPARTGSTYLVHLLRSNPQLICHDEALSLDELGGFSGIYARKIREIPGFEELLFKELHSNPGKFIRSRIFDSQGGFTVGFKYKTDESMSPRYQRYTKILTGDKYIKIVHLSRRNILDQFISHQVVLNQTGVTLLHKGDDIPKVERFSSDVSYVLRYFKDVIEREQLAVSMYRGHGQFSIDYEDILDKDSRQLSELQTFLSVEEVTLSCEVIKILVDGQSLLVNRDEIMNALRVAGYEGRF